jgi:putative ABC transport system permease protein
MIRHLVRLMWNRKRQNLMLGLEIFFAFLIVVATSVIVVHFGHNARQPLGFAIDDVWSIELNRGGPARPDEAAVERDRELLRQVMAEVGRVPGVERVASAFTGPYRWYSMTAGLDIANGRRVFYSQNRADDRFADVLRIPVVAGRWFSREDHGAGWVPVVVNARFARDAFGRENVVGEVIAPRAPAARAPGEVSRPMKVVGVIQDFRQFGELSTPDPVLITRIDLDAPPGQVELP